MFTPVSMRSANTYRTVDVESSVLGSNPHQLVGLMFSALLQSLAKARTAIHNRDTAAKVRSIAHALRLLEEGLKGALDTNRGGPLARNLANLYDYCVLRTTEANLRNDASMIDEVVALIQPVADGWSEIKGDAAVRNFQA
jgi:flagellar secretion chaperone FliS